VRPSSDVRIHLAVPAAPARPDVALDSHHDALGLIFAAIGLVLRGAHDEARQRAKRAAPIDAFQRVLAGGAFGQVTNPDDGDIRCFGEIDDGLHPVSVAARIAKAWNAAKVYTSLCPGSTKFSHER
jgi:hypothetical protein